MTWLVGGRKKSVQSAETERLFKQREVSQVKGTEENGDRLEILYSA